MTIERVWRRLDFTFVLDISEGADPVSIPERVWGWLGPLILEKLSLFSFQGAIARNP